MPVSYSLNSYSGSWTKEEASHLLRRTMLGPTYQQIQDAVSDGMNSTVNSLLSLTTVPLPITFRADDIMVGVGQTWINSFYPASDTAKAESQQSRKRSLYGWLMQNMNNEQEGLSINEKMMIFWTNHFGITTTADARSEYDYFKLLRESALGNFKRLVKDVTIHPQMLIFLNGNTNTKWQPNENFARELLELFTVGKGPQIGPGDYTNYTEYDIQECAKILTGYLVTGYRSTYENHISQFDATRHDESVKTLSSKFGNAVIQPNGANEYSDLIDVIFNQEAVSKYICKKLYIYFVKSEVTPEVESNIINGLAETLRNNNYEIQPVLEQLLKSEHFYDVSVRGCLIKSPIEFIFSMFNGSLTKADFDNSTNYEMYLSVYWQADALDQNVTAPPSVAGWPTYYQEPAFSRLWLNASLINERFGLIQWWVTYSGINKNGERFQVLGLDLVKSLSSPQDPVAVIDDLVDIFLPKGTTDTQKASLVKVLTDDLPDFEWTLQWTDYIANPNDEDMEEAVIRRIKETLTALFQSPEFQTV